MIKVIAFDADDTLWVNEPYFQAVEKDFCELLKPYGTPEEISAALFKTEMQNLGLYGYGAKGYMLSLMETALRISGYRLSPSDMNKLIAWGKGLLAIPICLLDGVEDVLKALSGRYRLVVATKGDLLDQQRKLERSGVSAYFDHIEIMSEKAEKDYEKLIGRLDITPDEFLMVGNSLRSDILPVLALGGTGVHVPFHTEWKYEAAGQEMPGYSRYKRVDCLRELIPLLSDCQ